MKEGWQRTRFFFKYLRGSRRWAVAVNVLLALALIIFIGRYLFFDLRAVFQNGVALSFSSVGLALGLYGFNFGLFIIAWHRIVVRLGGPADWLQNIFIYSYTNLARFLPTPLWFVTSRTHLYNQLGVKHRVALTMTAVETLLHILTGLVFYTLLVTNPEQPMTWLYAALALVPIAIVLSRPHWLELPKINGGKVGPGVRRQDVIIWVVLYLLTWVTAGPFFSAVINVFSKDTPSLSDLWRIWTLTRLVSYLATYVLGGIGILQEFTLTWLLSKFYSPVMALLIAIGIRLILILGGVLYGLTISGSVFILSRLGGRANPKSKRSKNA